ncbi:response regulator transcription factor [Paenibacillus thalictri]|nr:response regulator [Paenibacillus thalictri]
MSTILLVEDEASIRKGLKKCIETALGGWRITYEAANGVEALDILKKDLPEMIITDICMPQMDGMELIRKVRESHPHIPIVIISGYGEFQYAKQALKYDVIDYLLKPIDWMELVQILEKIKESQQRGERGESRHSEKSADAALTEEHPVVNKIQQYVQNRLDQDISLQYISEHFHLNYQYISALFKAKTGQTFTEYVTETRMRKARRLLKETHLKIYEIAELCGYQDVRHFMLTYKKLNGMTPSDYRRAAEY